MLFAKTRTKIARPRKYEKICFFIIVIDQRASVRLSPNDTLYCRVEILRLYALAAFQEFTVALLAGVLTVFDDDAAA